MMNPERAGLFGSKVYVDGSAIAEVLPGWDIWKPLNDFALEESRGRSGSRTQRAFALRLRFGRAIVSLSTMRKSNGRKVGAFDVGIFRGAHGSNRLRTAGGRSITVTVDVWNAGATLAQVLVALFTGVLALSTRNLARETKRMASETAELARDTVAATLSAERHHQEQMRPLLLLDSRLAVRAKTPRDAGFDYELSLEGDVCNFGGGPATTITLVVIPHGQVPKDFALGIVGPNTRYELKGIRWVTWASAGAFEIGHNWPFESVLGYSTVGFTLNVGTTKQSSASGSAEALRLEYVDPTDKTANPAEPAPTR